MAYFNPPQERPRHVKRFLTVRDVEDAAASGCRQILEADDLVITDAAKETAHDLGVAIIKPDRARREAATSPSVPAAAAQTVPQQAPVSPAAPPGMPVSATPPPSFSSASPASAPFSPSGLQPLMPTAITGTHGFAPPPAFLSPAGAHANEHPLVRDLVRAIRTRWRPVRRRQRQLLA